MSGRTSRRAALGAILAAPLTSVPAVAALGSDETRFLASASSVVARLDEYDRLWAESQPFHEAWFKAAEHLIGERYLERDTIPEWGIYCESRRVADEIDAELYDLHESYSGVRFQSLDAIMLRHRFALTFEWAEQDAADDVKAYWEARTCA
jgi:hypothetical protein